MYCENCGNQILDETKPCSSCGQMPEKRYDDGEGPKLVDYPMKWFKFLIYFSLFFGAVVNLINSFPYFTGTMYGENMYLVYMIYPAQKAVDVTFGIIMIALAIYQIVTRFALARYKACGPKMLYILYASSVVFEFLYCAVATAVTGINCFDWVGLIARLVVAVLFIALNYKYFKKREAYFVY